MPSLFFIGADKWSGISKLIEEAGEVLQVAGKLIGVQGEAKHWDRGDLYLRVAEELGDLTAAIDFVLDHAPVQLRAIVIARREEKYKLFTKWHFEARMGAEAEAEAEAQKLDDT